MHRTKQTPKHFDAMIDQPNTSKIAIKEIGMSLLRGFVNTWANRDTAILFCATLGLAFGYSANAQAGHSWAILIGPQSYHHASNLRFTVNDVEQLTKTLVDHGGFAEQRILKLVDTGPNEQSQPLRKSILAALPRWLAKPEPEDMVFVYFTGHGVRDQQTGKLYLAPLDCDPNDLTNTGVSVEWFRSEIANCRAKVKLLVLDSCFAGSEKGSDDPDRVTSKDLGASFEQLRNVVTLASSTDNQTSQMWPEMKQSLFSFWLNQALKGHADRDADSKVTIDEVFQYVHQHVTETAKNVFGLEQEPVRIVRTGTSGVPTVVQLTPYPLKGTLENMAEQLANTMRIKGLQRVGVAQFTGSTVDPKMTLALQNGPGLLGRECAAELERRLRRKRHEQFEVVSHDSLHKSLSTGKYSISDLKTSAIKGLTVEGKELPVVVISSLIARTGRIVTFLCQLVGTEDGQIYGTASGTAELGPSEWAMLGLSAAAQQGPRQSTPGNAAPAAPAAANAAIQQLEQQARKDHPLSDPTFPYRVRIMVEGDKGWQERTPAFRGNDMFVPLRRGETYSLWVENGSESPVFLRLLVDGLNTLPQESKNKGISIESNDPNYPAAQRVSLKDAEAWHMKPRLSPTEPKVNAVNGFFRKTGDAGSVIPFLVVDGEESFAHSQNFTSQIGIITAAFYRPRLTEDNQQRSRTPSTGTRGFGTSGGEERDESTDTYQGEEELGDLLAAIHIHYVSPANMPH